jgi:lipopolysaccharide transport system permease protein
MRAYLKKIYAARLNSTTVIDANNQWFRIDWVELWQFRDLIALFVEREFISRYRQTILGPLWYIIQPLMMSGVLSFVFGKIGAMSTEGIPHTLFYFSGLVVWGYFTTAFGQTADVLVANSYIFRKVYFPRLVMPLSVVISKALIFFTQLGIFLVMLLLFKVSKDFSEVIHPSLFKMMLFTPTCLLITAGTSLGMGLILAAITVKYKDLSHALSFFIQIWFYATPIVYSVRSVPEKYRALLLLNPLVSVVDLFRSAFLGTEALPSVFVLASVTEVLALVVIGVVLFNIIERDFVDVI